MREVSAFLLPGARVTGKTMKHLLALALGLFALHLARPAHCAMYMVAPQGSDSNRGDPARPFRTIGHAARQAQAGDMVVVAPGTYHESVVVTQSGAPEAPLVFRGLPGAVLISPDPGRSLSAFDIGPAVAHVTVQGFELGPGYHETVFVRSGAHHITLAGLYLHDNRSGIWIGGARQVVVRDCTIENHYRNGVRIFNGARYIEVHNTRVQGNYDGLGCSGDADGFSADSSTAGLYFEDVEAIENSEDGFDLHGRDNVILRAIARDNGCTGVKLPGGGYAENLLIENSRVGFSAGTDTALQNSTLAGNALGVRLLGTGHTVTIRNSIIAGPGKAICYSQGVELLEDHNILHRPNLKDRLIVREGSEGETLYSGTDINRGSWRRDSNQGQATVAGDPGFEPGSYRLSATSGAIDSGSLAGSPHMDIDAMLRPAGSGVDRGAFERIELRPTVERFDAAMVARPDGSGSVRLRADIRLPTGPHFDPSTDPMTVSLRGPRGTALLIEVAPTEWREARTRGVTVLQTLGRHAGGGRTRLMLRLFPDAAQLWVRARGADLWTLAGPTATLGIDLGPARVRVNAPLQASGSVLRLR